MTGENIILVVGVAIAFVALLLFAQFVYWTAQSRAEKQSRELSRRIGTLVDKTPGAALLRLNTDAQDGLAQYFEVLVRRAGSPYPVNTLYSRMAGGGVVGVLGLLVLFRSPACLLGAALAYLPVMIIRSQADTRARKLTEQLPEGLDLLARSLQAGHGLSEAIRGVAEEMPLPLAQEFGRVYEENNLGRDFRECLQNLNRRNPGSFDLQIFVSSVLLQRDTGGNLVEILQNISHTIRSRFVFQGKVRALTSEARFTAYILGGLPIFVVGVLIFLQPAYLRPLLTDPLGNMLLVGCLLSFSLGVFVMRELSKVEI